MERRLFLVGFPLAVAAWPLRAHHGWSGFDENRPIYLAGKAVEVRWQNPHAELILELSRPLALPADLATRQAPRQSAVVDSATILGKATLPRRTDPRWEVELAPLTRMNAWRVAEIKVGEALEVVGFAAAGEAGEPVLRAEFLIRGGLVTPLRSSPA